MSSDFEKIPREMREVMLNDFKRIVVDLESKCDTLGNDTVDKKIAKFKEQIQEIENLNRKDK